MSDSPESPCVGLCQVDAERVCLGCGRHIDEIVEWPFVEDDRKREILANARRRMTLLHAGQGPEEPSNDPAGKK